MNSDEESEELEELKNNMKNENVFNQALSFIKFWIKYMFCTILDIILNMIEIDNIYNFYLFLFPKKKKND
jgi:hypothetical protein